MPSVDIEQPDFCVKCGYDLTGLAERGRCPECGRPFDRTTGEGIRGAEPPKIRGLRMIRRVRTLVLASSAGGVMVVAVVVAWRWPSHAWGIVEFGGFIAGMVLLGAVTSFVYEKDNLPPV